jgi:hypothetical protein
MSVQSVTFAYNKQKIAEFIAETLDFTRDTDGLVLIASGEMVFQDTPLIEALLNHRPNCRVTISKDGQTVIDQSFDVTFFTLEPDQLAALLQ